MTRFRALAAKARGSWLMVLALVLGGAYFYQVKSDLDRASCQSRYNTASDQSANIRADLASRDRQATQSLLTGFSELVLNPTTDPELITQRQMDTLELFRSYNRAVRENDAAREANQPPPLPNC